MASTFLGGTINGYDSGKEIAVDPQGNVIVVGETKRGYFPTTAGAYERGCPGMIDVFVAKFDPSMKTLLAATLFGGGNNDIGQSVSVDSNGNIYIAGTTESYDLPTTVSTYQSDFQGMKDAFIAKFDSSLSTLLACTYLGRAQNDECNKLIIDSAGNVLVAGHTSSDDFPTTEGAYASSGYGFIAKFDSSLTSILAATKFKGGMVGLALDQAGDVFVTGQTSSSDFPTTPGAFQTDYHGGTGFISKFNSSLSTLKSSTFLSGTDGSTCPADLVISSVGHIFLTGRTDCSDFPTTDGAYSRQRKCDPHCSSCYDGFISRFNNDLSRLLASTYLGGDGKWFSYAGNDCPTSIKLDVANNVFICGYTESSSFPTTANVFMKEKKSQYSTGFVSVLDGNMKTLISSTYLGGSSENGEHINSLALDNNANIFLTGQTDSADFPTTEEAYDTVFYPAMSAFVTRFDKIVVPQAQAKLYSPDGEESWAAGTVQTLIWSVPNSISHLLLEYSSDNGSSWGIIAESAPNNGVYEWTIPNAPSNTCMVRLRNPLDGSLVEMSDTVFSILNPAMQMLFPNGGETIKTGEKNKIRWTKNSLITDVRIEYSIDSGSNWSDIVASTPNFGEYDWKVPQTPSTNCLVRVSDVTDSVLSARSEAVFTIKEKPYIEILSPNGGESWMMGAYGTVTWNSSSSITKIYVEISYDGGDNWLRDYYYPVNNSGTYDIMPRSVSSNCLVKVSNANNSEIFDCNDSHITVLAPVMTVITPNGGEVWQAGSTQRIQYNRTGGYPEKINIEYSIDGGLIWDPVYVPSGTTNAFNELHYDWVVPDTPSSTCLVRIVDQEGVALNEVSDNVFTILPATLEVTSPNGGENWFAGSSHQIMWNKSGKRPANVKIDYSADNGLSWNEVVNSVSNSGNYDWKIPDTPSISCLVRISDPEDGTPVDISNATFTILAPTITLSTPNGGNKWYVDSTQRISWSRSGTLPATVNIDYSTDNGNSWINLVTATLNDGSYDQIVPDTPSTTCLVRVSDSVDGSPSDVSNAPFEILPPSLTIRNPNGGQILQIGSSPNITWNRTGSIANVKLEFTTDGGTSWQTIIDSTPNDGTYPWVIPEIVTSECLVRVSDALDGIPSDVSNAPSSIEWPTLILTAPNGNETWFVGSKQNIRWNKNGTIPAKVDIEYSIDNGTVWNTVASSTSNTGAYSWTIPDTTSSSCLVRISDSEDGTPVDVSDEIFTISSSSLNITAPNGGEQWLEGSTQKITWDKVGTITYVKIEYSVDNGINWSTINASVNNSGSYNWVLPNTISDQCLVRISDKSNSSANDISDSTFAVVKLAPLIAVSQNNLHFASRVGSNSVKTGSQDVLVGNNGNGSLAWAAASNSNWLTISPKSGTNGGKIIASVTTTGLAVGLYTGQIEISNAIAANSPQFIEVVLTVLEASPTNGIIGGFDQPTDGDTVAGNIALSGWALDDIEATYVRIYREGTNNALVLVGNASFIDRARPDIELLYPNHPRKSRAAWAYSLLTHNLPNQGMNDSFVIHAVATNKENKTFDLGTKTIHCQNQSNSQPFGEITAPMMGAAVSGSYYNNSAWILTPQPQKMSEDGSGITVLLDGLSMGNPIYNKALSSITSRFPGYANSSAPGGSFTLNTNLLPNGLHTLSWQATDDGGNSALIGPHFFQIFNNGSTLPLQGHTLLNQALSQDQADVRILPEEYIQDHSEIRIIQGFGEEIHDQFINPSSSQGMYMVYYDALSPLVVELNPGQHHVMAYRGFELVNQEMRSLPAGSILDSEKGFFYWQPGIGFLGQFDLIFRNELNLRCKRIRIIINTRRSQNKER